jgi:hypothetical protein
MKTFRQRAQQQTTDALIEIGLPVIPDLAARLGDAVARGRTLAKAGRSVRSQREYERWNDAVAHWRTAIAETLEGGFATPVARDAMRDVWVSNTPLCTIWPDWLKAEQQTLNAALDFADRIREAAASYTA